MGEDRIRGPINSVRVLHTKNDIRNHPKYPPIPAATFSASVKCCAISGVIRLIPAIVMAL